MNIIKRVYSLSEIKYPSMLLLSMSAFIMSFCIGRYYRDLTPAAEAAMYGIGFAIALIWSILNYMGHLKLSRIYKKYDTIGTFVEYMTMEDDEKIELIQYLNDFVKDLEERGENHENAVKKAISHFQVQEFSEIRGSDIFEKHSHYYLFGYVSIFLGAFLVISLLNAIVHITFILAAINLTLVIYGIGLFLLFFLYKLIDILMAKK